MSKPHCGLPRDDLLVIAQKLLDIPADILTDALGLELAERTVVSDTIADRECVFLAHLWHAERLIAERLRDIANGKPPWPAIDADKAIPWVEGKLGVELAASQRRAVAVALASKIIVITGGPGVGKTTLTKSILTIVAAKSVSVAACAPTGRAAKRLSEATGLEAKTIHRLLEVDPKRGGFGRNEDKPLACDLLVVDETSTVGVPLMASLVRALPSTAALMLVGDVDQLPSVGPGQVLADVIDSGAMPVARLTEVFRQAAESLIIRNAHRINRGEMPELPSGSKEPSDFYFVDAADPEDGMRKVIEVVRNRIPLRFGLDPIRDVQVLVQ